MVKNKKNKDSIDEKYQKMDHRTHVYTLPDTYCGSVEKLTSNLYVFNEEKQNIIKKEISYVPALYKIVDEIIVNASDQDTRLRLEKAKNLVTTIKVNINKETGQISVYNNGKGIEIVPMKKHKGIYPPTLIFGHLLSSSNYKKNDSKASLVTGGKNGLGSKITNIFSKLFIVETVDHERKLKFEQTFTENMKKKMKPIIEPYTDKPFTKITFIPDYKRFGMDGLDDDTYSLLKKRVYDLAAWTNKSVKIYFNDTKIDLKSFEEYANLYIGDKEHTPRVYEKINKNWEVIACTNENEVFEQISFVNGINTIRGGKHVEYIVDQIKNSMAELINKQDKLLKIKPVYVRNQLMVFVKSTIVNPSFDGQTKETLTTTKKKFGSTAEISKEFIKELSKTGIIERIKSQAEYKNNKILKKTDGKKTGSVRGIPKLTDANKAGGRESHKCTLILTEGDSAKTMAIAGLSEVGRDYYGVFPLKGKLLNVLDAPVDKILKNTEIMNIKKIVGLKTDEVYTDVKNLRYGKIMIMTDQDVDGSHIKGLFINFVNTFWPSLLKLEKPFMTCLLTPIIKATRKKKTISFYNLTEYKNWKEKEKKTGWKIKYYKGLGTSTTKEAKEYFKELHQVFYNHSGDKCQEAIDLSFNKKRADDRKVWLQNYDEDNILDFKEKNINFDDFTRKELIHFSNDDLNRSIPSLMDGLKPSQRKIMYSCFKRNLVKEIKVAQLAGYVSEHSGYHHGEMSLQGAIVGLAQNYVGSNNINLLKPNGQFGSRIQGGKDSASARYIFTELGKLTKHIYNPDDFPLLKYLDDDGYSIEPQFYTPIIPMVLINTTTGIGTGYSTDIPNYNPKDIIKYINNKLDNKSSPELHPYYKNFTGKIMVYKTKKINDSETIPTGYITKGKYKKIGATKIEITELPIGTWSENYKNFLESLLIDKSNKKKKQILRSYEDHCTESTVNFKLRFNAVTLVKLMQKKSGDPLVDSIEKELKLTSRLNLTNMHLYNSKGRIQKYTTVEEIINEFIGVRELMYKIRKDFKLKKIIKELELIDCKVKFINEILNDTIDLRKKKKELVEKILFEKNYPKLSNKIEINPKNINQYIKELDHNIDKEDNYIVNKQNYSYDYLVKMPLDTLTEEKVTELQKQKDNKLEESNILKELSIKTLWKCENNEILKLLKKNKKNN